MFCAIDISGGRVAYHRMLSVQQSLHPKAFRLDGEALELYLKAYGKDSYKTFNAHLDAVASRALPVQDVKVITHNAFHDAESVFWVIVWFLMRAWPSGTDDTPSEDYIAWAKIMLDHSIGSDGRHARCYLTGTPSFQWEAIVHPGCAKLVDMVVQMCKYVSIRWLQYPDLSPYHMHEALKRLLFKEIVRMSKDEDPIPIQGPRRLPTDKNRPRAGIVNSGSRISSLSSQTTTSGPERSSQKRSRSEAMEEGGGGPSTRPVRRKYVEPQHTKIVKDWIKTFQIDENWFC